MENIGFIGAGKVGFSLGKLFCENGIHVTGYYSQHVESAKKAAEFTDTRCYDLIDELVDESDVIFLTVPDDAILSVYEKIKLKKLNVKNKILCHCSGSMSANEAFYDIESLGGFGYSLHPLFPVSNRYDSYKEMKGAFFCVEGSPKYLEEWKEFFRKIGIRTRSIKASDKVKYHAACAISSNLMCALLKQSIEMLKQCGFKNDEALEALAPLVKSNFEHMLLDGPVKALTGPMERADANTIKKHLECFSTSHEREMYKVISKKLLTISKEKNPQRNYEEIANLLKGYED